MKELEWSTQPPEEAGYWWYIYPNNKISVPMLAMVVRYPDDSRMMTIGDSKQYIITSEPSSDILWAGPVEYPAIPTKLETPEPNKD